MTAQMLKPCPFCGGSATMEQTEDNRWSVGCDSADEPACMGYQSLTTFGRQGEATAAWNKRARSSAGSAEAAPFPAFNYLTPEIYNADMQQLADRAVSAVNDLLGRLKSSELMLALVVMSSGQARISKYLLEAPPDIQVTFSTDPTTQDVIIKAEEKRGE